MTRQNGMEKPVLTELPTISDRMTFIYLEHCRISRELFPAYAGVILAPRPDSNRRPAFPRVSGGDPDPQERKDFFANFSPHMRG